MAFTDAPRNVAQSAHVVVLTSAQSVGATDKLVDLLTSYELLQTQAREIVDTKIWAADIAPNL